MTAAHRDVGIYRKSAPFFLALMLLAIPAFWPSYLAVEKVECDYHVHLHGISLFLWGGMLIVQPWLIYRGQWSLHRALGKLSYVLAPLVVVSTILLGNHRLKQGITPDHIYFLYVQVQLLFVFSLAYVLAIKNRHTPALHARYMVCTALAMFDPIVARLLYLSIGVDYPAMQAITWLAIDAILLYLWKRDRDAGNGVQVFPRMLAVIVTLQIPTFFLYKTNAWISFTKWYAELPLP